MPRRLRLCGPEALTLVLFGYCLSVVRHGFLASFPDQPTLDRMPRAVTLSQSTLGALPLEAATKGYQQNTLADSVGQANEPMSRGGSARTAALYRLVNNDPTNDIERVIDWLVEKEPMTSPIPQYFVLNRIASASRQKRIAALLAEKGYQVLNIPFNDTELFLQQVTFRDFGPVDVVHDSYRWQKAWTQERPYKSQLEYLFGRTTARKFVQAHANQMRYDWAIIVDANCLLLPKYTARIASELMALPTNETKAMIPVSLATLPAAQLGDFDSRWDQFPIGKHQEAIKVGFKQKKHTGPVIGQLPQLYVTTKPLPWSAKVKAQRLQYMRKQLALVITKMGQSPSRTLLIYNMAVLKKERKAYQVGGNEKLTNLIGQLVNLADYALQLPNLSVMAKRRLAPSNDTHDYFSVKPYYWPNPNTANGMPYIRRDGQRVPGTVLYDKESADYDRTALASMFGNVTVLALANYITGHRIYAEKAVAMIGSWFLSPETAMNPHCRYAQVQWGKDGNTGRSTGILEFRDFVFFLDAVKLLAGSGAFPLADQQLLSEWLKKYSLYLDTSVQGLGEYMAPNNHGVYFDVQRAALANHLGDVETALGVFICAKSRIQAQFAQDGTMPQEMVRESQLHYMLFTLQGWFSLATMGLRYGVDLWYYQDVAHHDPALVRSAVYSVPQLNASWQHPQATNVDMDRAAVLYYEILNQYPELGRLKSSRHWPRPDSHYSMKPIFDELDGIPPFWNLGLM